MKFHAQYQECPACGQVVYDPRLKLARVDEPAPCCGAFGKSRTVWPSFEVQKFLEIVGNQDLNSNEERPIAIVFLCTAIELLLESSLWKLLGVHTKSRQLAEFVLENTWGKERRIRLYNKLSDCPLGDLFKSKGIATFLEDWDRLSKLRNDIVHGQYYSGGANEADLIRSVYANCLKAFAEIHNDVQRMLRLNVTKV